MGHWLQKRHWLKEGVAVVVGGLLTIAVQGIISNRADGLFLLFITWLSKTINTNVLSWSIAGMTLATSLGLAFYCWQHGKILSQALKRANTMAELDGSLLRALASWIPSTNRDDEIELILKGILRDATTEFDGLVHRAAILVPDAKREYLKCWANYQMPQESIENMEFYIGSDSRKRQDRGGVAGEVFLSEKLSVGHMTKVNNQWICGDCDNYVKFCGQRPFPPYRSFVNVPIIGTDPFTRNTTKCLGVVCFDSSDDKVFDSEEIKEVLLTLASHIAAAILLCEKIS